MRREWVYWAIRSCLIPVFVFVAGLAGNGVVEAPLRALQKIHTGYNN